MHVPTDAPAQSDEGTIFPTFLMSGFECSTFIWKDVGRRDLIAETRHREHAIGDYELLASLGIGVAREAVPWPLVARGPSFDFSLVDPVIDGITASGVVPLWDLCHYGYPDDADPFSSGFAERFADYCFAAARHVAERVGGDWGPFFAPMNEITYFSQAGGLWGLIAPFGRDRETYNELRVALCGAAIAGIDAIRSEYPQARMVAMDPVVNIVAPRDRPDLVELARTQTWEDPYVAWDILAGMRHPELGGAPDKLDIVGVNCYSFGQQELRGDGPHVSLDPGDDRIIPVRDLIEYAARRYGRPVIVAETSGLREGRDEWLEDVMQEALAAVYDGINVQGVCLYPAVDMPDWNNGEWLHNGIADLVPVDGDLHRVPDLAYVERIRSWQRRLNEADRVTDDVLSSPVDYADVVRAAHALRPEGDPDWH
jgi:hypothetical protein